MALAAPLVAVGLIGFLLADKSSLSDPLTWALVGIGSASALYVLMLGGRRLKMVATLIYDEIDPLTGAARDAVFMNQIDGSCPLMSVCIERITQTSSTICEK